MENFCARNTLPHGLPLYRPHGNGQSVLFIAPESQKPPVVVCCMSPTLYQQIGVPSLTTVSALGAPDFFLALRGRALDEERLERAIGVVYRPETERASHYLRARLAEQFDAVLHFDVTRALEPLERSAEWESGEPPETYPSGE